MALAAEPHPLPQLRRLLALLLVAVRSETPAVASAEWEASVHDVLKSPLLGGKVAKGVADIDASAIRAHREACAQLGLQPGAAAIISNGRIVHVSGGAGAVHALDDVDLSLLEEFEFKQRAEGPGKHIALAQPPDGTQDADADDWRSDALMFAAAQLSAMRLAAHEASDGRRKMQLGDDIPCGKACTTLAGHGAGEAMELVAVLDPLSKEAQRFAPIATQLQQVPSSPAPPPLRLSVAALSPYRAVSHGLLSHHRRCWA